MELLHDGKIVVLVTVKFYEEFPLVLREIRLAQDDIVFALSEFAYSDAEIPLAHRFVSPPS